MTRIIYTDRGAKGEFTKPRQQLKLPSVAKKMPAPMEMEFLKGENTTQTCG